MISDAFWAVARDNNDENVDLLLDFGEYEKHVSIYIDSIYYISAVYKVFTLRFFLSRIRNKITNVPFNKVDLVAQAQKRTVSWRCV